MKNLYVFCAFWVSISAVLPGEDTQEFWNLKASLEIEEAIKPRTEGVAKNVILFVGDGMGMTSLTAARIYKGQVEGGSGEESKLAFEAFPSVGLCKTYCVDTQVPDSAATATAYLSGVKTNRKLIGYDASATYDDCTTGTPTEATDSIAKWALDAGKRVGIVTTSRVTHATPAAAYAHSVNRDWECENTIDLVNQLACPGLKDIARQFVEEDPGLRINVLLGGGYECFEWNLTSTSGDPVDPPGLGCKRNDGRSLWQEWLDIKDLGGLSAEFVQTKLELDAVDLNATEYLMGLFSNGHMPYQYRINELSLDMPTLAEMTRAAISLLNNGPNGFFLLVESGKIDTANHDNLGRTALSEVVALNDAVQMALSMVDTNETLIVTTADHSHAVTMSGYPPRGGDILGFAEEGYDGLPYTTLMYATGLGFNYTVKQEIVGGGYKAVRWNLTDTDTTSHYYLQQAAVPKTSASHSGEDIPIYAIGPMSYLFHSTHEQNYIAHAMAYASCIGAHSSRCL